MYYPSLFLSSEVCVCPTHAQTRPLFCLIDVIMYLQPDLFSFFHVVVCYETASFYKRKLVLALEDVTPLA